MSLTLTEQKMWPESTTKGNSQISNGRLKPKYPTREPKILLEANWKQLPSLVASLKKPGSMDLKPFYQRRKPWNKQQQSRLIESFLINIPVPAIVLYEKHYKFYEVMDGQQRIATIRNFYENKFELTGLEFLPELEGFTYKELPSNVRVDLDRRSISSVTIITELNFSSEKALFLRQKTFERLNSGAVNLSDQEVRNCLYQGKLNSLLHELANNEIFVKAWKLPITKNMQERNFENIFIHKMEDIELILRFFALRNADNFSGTMKDFLDIYMMKSMKFSEAEIEFLETTFLETIALADELYGEYLFKPFDPKSGTWEEPLSKAYYDAVMVGFSEHLSNANLLRERKSKVIEETKNIFKKDKAHLLTSSGGTKYDVLKRIELFDEMLSQVIGE